MRFDITRIMLMQHVLITVDNNGQLPREDEINSFLYRCIRTGATAREKMRDPDNEVLRSTRVRSE